jgi:PmbA protein
VESTGNASRPTLWAPIGAAPTVFYIQPGEMEASALQAKLGDGLIITDLMGLHSGLSAISGDFSLKADGKLVKDGKVVQVVEGITVAGNFLTMLQAVEAVANDLKFALPQSAYCAAPSLLVSALTVAGE